jgi:nitric oxide reductase large subunit
MLGIWLRVSLQRLALEHTGGTSTAIVSWLVTAEIPHAILSKELPLLERGMSMTGVILLFIVISLLLFIGALHYYKLLQQSASYPPKKVVKQKVTVLASAGGVTLLIGIILIFFQ